MGKNEHIADHHLDDEEALRTDLAAAFRLCVHFGWHESVGNHFSAALSEDGKTFLLNPKWQHFSTIKASDLAKVSVADDSTVNSISALDASAWALHGRLHAQIPRAKVLLHCHPKYATALCGLADPSIQPIDQNTARFFNRHVVDLGFSGMADEAGEADRIAAALGDQSIMLMGNHGVLITGETIAESFEDLYFLEKAAQTMVLAYSTGQPLNVMSGETAEKVARSWDDYRGAAFAHYDHLKTMLGQQDPSYRD